MTVGERLKEARKKKGYTQKALAEKLGLSQQNIAEWERGKRNPKMTTLQKISEALEIPVSDLYKDTWGYKPNTPGHDYSYLIGAWEVEKRLPPGYRLQYNDEDAMLWLVYPDGSYSRDISFTEIEEIVNKATDYLMYELEKLRR